MDHDDKYRMVEDEFLAVAQKWTVHLHAAEYKRQEKLAKTRNAETINSLWRPVTQKMPDHTRRKVDGVATSKAQRNALEGFLGKKAHAEDTDSDEGSLPYVGTSLHGLMDTPGKKSASLSKVGSIKATTRAAAGFQKPAETKKPFTHTTSSSLLASNKNPPTHAANESDISTASEDEDDDLDAPIPTPRLQSAERKLVSTGTTSLNAHPVPPSSLTRTSEAKQRSTLIHSTAATVEAAVVEKVPSKPISIAFELPVAEISGGWRARKLEKARQEKEEQEKREQRRP